MIVSNIFEKIPEAFGEGPCATDEIRLLGRRKNQRIFRTIKQCYVANNPFLKCYNIATPKSNGSGFFGEALASAEILNPAEGATDTFISIGLFGTRVEAENLQKYIKSKFFRALLGIKKVTQDNPPAVWCCIPIQDFTPASDIDWTKSSPEIDQQLYKKYGLDETEIQFIETHVKEMT